MIKMFQVATSDLARYAGQPMRIGLLMVLAVCLPPALAEPADRYQLEVILFDYIEPDTGGELWLENPGLPLRDDAIELIIGDPTAREATGAAAAGLRPYYALQERFYGMRAAYRALRLSAEYRPLLHVAWQQPGPDGRRALAVRLDNTLFAAQQAIATPSRSGDAATWPDEPAVVEQQAYQPPELLYDGLVRLRSARFLHLDVDFAYFPAPDKAQVAGDAATTPNSSRSTADYVRLTESRRVTPDNTYYFDHPMFGLIVSVTRLAADD